MFASRTDESACEQRVESLWGREQGREKKLGRAERE